MIKQLKEIDLKFRLLSQIKKKNFADILKQVYLTFLCENSSSATFTS